MRLAEPASRVLAGFLQYEHCGHYNLPIYLSFLKKMADYQGARFTKYFPAVLDALRSSAPEPMRPAEMRAWVRSNVDVAQDDLTRQIVNSRQSIFENDIHWVRFYLTKAGLLTGQGRGLWSLTETGRHTYLSDEQASKLYEHVRDTFRKSSKNDRENNDSSSDESDIPAPDVSVDDADDSQSYWFAGALWEEGDQLDRFLKDGIWENGYEDRFIDDVNRIKIGDRIAVKSAFVQKNGLPFDVDGKSVAVMRIKATGIVTKNPKDGRVVEVDWDPVAKPRDWYFYTYRSTLVEADIESEGAMGLVDFTFRGAAQDYDWYLAQPYWLSKYGAAQVKSKPDVEAEIGSDEFVIEEAVEQITYTLDNVIKDGCFLSKERLEEVLQQWVAKKNLILQGPPGTGKTWLAKKLAYALIGSDDRELTRSRLRIVQFHPSISYEDFVRGWRPAGNGQLALVDGVLMQAINAALSEPDIPFVLVIEEINRGNPVQILGEMLTLIEASKRRSSEAIELAYRDPKKVDERVYIPANLYIIGTMNVADRSLAIVDFALRRRFAFVDLQPEFGQQWVSWCTSRGLQPGMCETIRTGIRALNDTITDALMLGPQFCIGHSYLTPGADEVISDGNAWFKSKVETEIGPLLDEYWFDAKDEAKKARLKLAACIA